MVKPVPAGDFRAIRRILEEDDFAVVNNDTPLPKKDRLPVDVWHGVQDLADMASIMTTEFHGNEISKIYNLWSDWVLLLSLPTSSDEIGGTIMEAGDCFYCSIFEMIHGFYRSSISNLRTALELVMIGAAGKLNPSSPSYQNWKDGRGEMTFNEARQDILKSTKNNSFVSWIFEDKSLVKSSYQTLCHYTHARPGHDNIALWGSNGPIYSSAALNKTISLAYETITLCMLVAVIAQPSIRAVENHRDALLKLIQTNPTLQSSSTIAGLRSVFSSLAP